MDYGWTERFVQTERTTDKIESSLIIDVEERERRVSAMYKVHCGKLQQFPFPHVAMFMGNER